jgi:transcription elongation factor GreA
MEPAARTRRPGTGAGRRNTPATPIPLTIPASTDTIPADPRTSVARRRPARGSFVPSRPSGGTTQCPLHLGGPNRVNTKTTYISKDGLDKLRAELDEMVAVRRPEIAQRIHDAKEHGDLSENAEYEDAKNEQAFVEGRIQTLEAMIKNATLIDEHTSTDHVQIGSTVKVKGDDGPETFLIVGSAEAKPAQGRISNESPVGRALLGRKKGEKVVVKVPAGDFSYTIVEIS